MKKKMICILLSAVISIFAFGHTLAAIADSPQAEAPVTKYNPPNTPVDPYDDIAVENAINEYHRAMEFMKPFLMRNGDGTLNIARAVGIVDDELYHTVKTQIEERINPMIRQGYLRSDEHEIGVLEITEQYLEYAQNQINNYQPPAKNGGQYFVGAEDNALTLHNPALNGSGVNKVVWHWYGYELYLDSETAQKVALGYNIAGILICMIPEVGAIIGGALLVEGALIGHNNRNGTGVILYYTRLNPAFFYWIKPQR